MVLFERGDCAACAEWHSNVLGDDDIRRVLARFQVVQLDMNDTRSKLVTPAGKATTPAQWAGDLGLSYAPSIVLYDEHGKLRQLIDFPVLHQRLMRSLLYMTEKAYERGITYQRFTREKTAERVQREAARQGVK
jgi:thioredoxin-related protein